MTDASATILPRTHEILLWLDVETTGLDPARDALLEIAAVATTFDEDFAPIGQPFSRVLELPDLKLAAVEPAVIAMHAANGLWDECFRSRLTESEMFESLRRWWWNTRPVGAESVYAAGRSVHFDLEWLRRSDETWSELRLHHRRFDLTPIKAFASLAGISFGVPEDAHRALADIEEDIQLARALVALVRGMK